MSKLLASNGMKTWTKMRNYILRPFRQKSLTIFGLCGFTIIYLGIKSSYIPKCIDGDGMQQKITFVGAQLFPSGHDARKDWSRNEARHKERRVHQVPKMHGNMSCQLPLLNPFDPSVMKFYDKPKLPSVAACKNDARYPLLFTTDLGSILIQVSQPEKHGYYFCCYNSFRRKSDLGVHMSSECRPITKVKTKIPESVEFIQISCANHSSVNATKIPVDMFGFIHFKKSVKMRAEAILRKNEKLPSNSAKAATSTEKKRRKMNVVVFGIDGLSHMNFIRSMPQSFDYIKNNLNGLGLWGFTKVGENTLPNIVPALTGLFLEELNTTGRCWKSKADVFDNCPFIWKDYANQGYATAFGEDAVWMTGFNHMKKGFRFQPTDYYHNTVTKFQDYKTGHTKLLVANVCYGPRLSFEILLDYTRKMATAMKPKEQRYFQFIWSNALTHDFPNEGERGDHFLLETLRWFKNKGFLNDTVLVLMSDHGVRVSNIMPTYQGRVELRMPFLYFIFPQWFREKYPSALSNLLANQHRLTTPFDLHATLKDLLFLENIESANVRKRQLNLAALTRGNKGLPRGISLFLPVPLKRTCADASIPDQWCVCRKALPVTLTNNTLVAEAARIVVHFINGMLIKNPQCEILQLKQVLSAEVFQSENDKVMDVSEAITNSSDPRLAKQQVKLRVSLTVKPSNASFEAMATRQTDGAWTVSNEISRTNFYGNQSRCVSDYELKKFCYCG